MTLSHEDIEALIAELQQNPQLRDRVRNAILADDFLALPGIVARLGERVEGLESAVTNLTAEVARIGAELAALATEVRQLSAEVARLVRVTESHDGRLGNIEGDLYELRYADRLPARLGRRYVRVRRVHVPEVERVSDAYTARGLVKAEWDDLLEIDAAAWA